MAMAMISYIRSQRNHKKKKKKNRCVKHFLQNGLCQITFLRMSVLPTTYTFAGPAFQKCCKNTCTAGLPHDTAAA